MTDATDRLTLAADFPPASRPQWLALVEQLLKGAPFERTLVARTHDGLTIQPLYAGSKRMHARPGRTPGEPWKIFQRVDHPDPTAAGEEARDEFRDGANGLSVVFARSVGAYGYGLAGDRAAAARALRSVALDAPGCGFELDCGSQADAAARSMLSLVRERGIPAGIPDIRFGFDPLGLMAASGGSVRWSESADQLCSSLAALAGEGCRGPFVVADGRVVHNAGGSEAQELAFVLASALTYLRTLEDGGVARERARAMIYFRLSADADQFLTIAKFRALRDLWGRIEEACDLAPAPIHISAETAWRMMTQRDPYANMLRATIAVFAAGVGGADSVTVLPFTLARGLPDRFARRIARNTQLILAGEAHLARVSDATAGTGVIDDLIGQLSRAAWKLFQDIERAGGAVAALEQGLLQKGVAVVRGERQAALAHRSDTLVGTSDFADLAEAAVAVLDVAPSKPLDRAAPAFEPLPCTRLAEPFDRLRDASDRMAESGARPKIFLANLGPAADFPARAAFAKNFFEAGGIAAVSNDGFADAAGATDLAALAAAFKDAGTTLACLCGSDQAYAEEAVAAVKALSTAGARHLYCAGHRDEALAAAGVATFIRAGCDALAILHGAQEQFAARSR